MRNGNTREESTNWMSINDGTQSGCEDFQNLKHLKPNIQLGCLTPTDPLDSLDKAFNDTLTAYGPSKGLEAIVDSLATLCVPPASKAKANKSDACQIACSSAFSYMRRKPINYTIQTPCGPTQGS